MQSSKPQLRMIWPDDRLNDPPRAAVHPDYVLRQLEVAESESYCALLVQAGFESWDQQRFREIMPTVITGGWFVAIHRQTGELAATAVAQCAPLDSRDGQLGWVAAHPAHRGRSLGAAVCSAATAGLLAAGYQKLYLLTDDHRLPAIRLYLGLGWTPWITDKGAEERWAQVLSAISTGARG